jgi:hypothetical protein
MYNRSEAVKSSYHKLVNMTSLQIYINFAGSGEGIVLAVVYYPETKIVMLCYEDSYIIHGNRNFKISLLRYLTWNNFMGKFNRPHKSVLRRKENH